MFGIIKGVDIYIGIVNFVVDVWVVIWVFFVECYGVECCG